MIVPMSLACYFIKIIFKSNFLIYVKCQKIQNPSNFKGEQRKEHWELTSSGQYYIIINNILPIYLAYKFFPTNLAGKISEQNSKS